MRKYDAALKALKNESPSPDGGFLLLAYIPGIVAGWAAVSAVGWGGAIFGLFVSGVSYSVLAYMAGGGQAEIARLAKLESLLAANQALNSKGEEMLDGVRMKKSIALKRFRKECETCPGYPPDWEMRRLETFQFKGKVCDYCGYSPEENGPRRNIHLHHKVSLRDGGTHEFSNLQPLCDECHKVVDSVHSSTVVTKRMRMDRKGAPSKRQEINSESARLENAGKPWTLEMRDALAVDFKNGSSSEELALGFKRSVGAIKSELARQGLIDYHFGGKDGGS
jgi:hypothetical protein